MAFTTRQRKVEMLRNGVTGRAVAAACEVDPTLVSHVVGGRRWNNDGADKVMRFLAGVFGVPVEQAFPGAQMSERRGGERRQASA